MNENIDHMGLIPMSAELTMFYTDFTSSLAIAKSQERDRIIQLLEDNASHYGCDWACIAECDAPTFVQLIELIKGD